MNKLIFCFLIVFSALYAGKMHPKLEGIPSKQQDVDALCSQCHDVQAINDNSTHSKNISCVDCHVKGEITSANIQRPDNQSCLNCHAAVGQKSGSKTHQKFSGEVLSADHINRSALNVQGKSGLTGSFDIHLNRGMVCADCHSSPENPGSAAVVKKRPAHLRFDPRKQQAGEYLNSPSHRLSSAECTDCHEGEKAHKGFPHLKNHLKALDCLSCHAPELYGPALMVEDKSFLKSKNVILSFQNSDEVFTNEDSIKTAFFKPVAPRYFTVKENDAMKIAPYTVSLKWFWKDLKTSQEADLSAVQKAADSAAGADEVSKKISIKKNLELAGITAELTGETRFQRIRHNASAGKGAVRECADCHGKAQRMKADITFKDSLRAGVLAAVTADKEIFHPGKLSISEQGWVLQRESIGDFHLPGYTRSLWIDGIGILFLLMTVAGILIHGILRRRALKNLSVSAVETHRIYKYPVYERVWHWLLAFGTFILLLTGFEIHYSDLVQIFGMQLSVQLHNVFSVVVIINAALALFFWAASGRLKEFIPRFHERSHFEAMRVMTSYYMKGIFKGEPHPKMPGEGKLNALQQTTYFFLLNLLLPAQIFTGALMWFIGSRPDLLALPIGLSYLAPFHAFLSWIFLCFLIAHMYLITTGETVSVNMKAMLTGWEEKHKENQE